MMAHTVNTYLLVYSTEYREKRLGSGEDVSARLCYLPTNMILEKSFNWMYFRFLLQRMRIIMLLYYLSEVGYKARNKLLHFRVRVQQTFIFFPTPFLLPKEEL